MKKINKKADFGMKMFGFFFILTIISGLFFFLSVNLHYILFDYGIQPILDVKDTLGISEGANTAIEGAATSFLGMTDYMDYFFGVLLLSMFISGIISSIQARQYGLISFFGMITLGNLFLIFILSLAVQVRGWFLNNIAYAIQLTPVSMPILTFFYNYTYYIVILMFLTFLTVNQLDLAVIREKFSALFNKDKEETGGDFSLKGGKFEE